MCSNMYNLSINEIEEKIVKIKDIMPLIVIIKFEGIIFKSIEYVLDI